MNGDTLLYMIVVQKETIKIFERRKLLLLVLTPNQNVLCFSQSRLSDESSATNHQKSMRFEMTRPQLQACVCSSSNNKTRLRFIEVTYVTIIRPSLLHLILVIHKESLDIKIATPLALFVPKSE